MTNMIISRADAIEVVHKYFIEALDNEPHEIDEDGYDVFTDMKSVNALLHHNKMISKALKALPSADRPPGKWVLDPNGLDWNLPSWRCSECGFVASYIGVETDGLSSNPMNWAGSKFCPNCGARMKGAEHNGFIRIHAD